MKTKIKKHAASKTLPRINVLVYRRLDNRLECLADDSPRALELHNRRKKALHEVFDTENSIEVLDWGKTDDTKSHEVVEILLAAIAAPVFQYAMVPGLKFLGQKLAEKAVDQAASELVKAVVSWLRGPQEKQKLLNLIITLPDQTQIRVDPPDRYATIEIHFTDGKFESITYAKLPLAVTG
jgi:hypothetical protein